LAGCNRRQWKIGGGENREAKGHAIDGLSLSPAPAPDMSISGWTLRGLSPSLRCCFVYYIYLCVIFICLLFPLGGVFSMTRGWWWYCSCTPTHSILCPFPRAVRNVRGATNSLRLHLQIPPGNSASCAHLKCPGRGVNGATSLLESPAPTTDLQQIAQLKLQCTQKFFLNN